MPPNREAVKKLYEEAKKMIIDYKERIKYIKEHPEEYVDIIAYNAAIDLWEKKLERRVEQVRIFKIKWNLKDEPKSDTKKPVAFGMYI